MTGLGGPVLLLIAVFGLAAGVGITAVGPGGVLATVGLFALTGLTPAQVAGTALVTHIATGALGTAAYTRSGQLRDAATRRTARVLATSAAVGTPLGVLINTVVSGRDFGLLLGTFVALVGLLLWRRDREEHTDRMTDQGSARDTPEHAAPLPWPLLAGVGFAVAVAGGMFGIGGPMLAVPLLVTLGVPVLAALAAAQAQSIVIASVGSLGYLAHDSIDWPLAAVVGIPELAGVLIGWAIARSLPTRTLKFILVATLVIIAPYLALHG